MLHKLLVCWSLLSSLSFEYMMRANHHRHSIRHEHMTIMPLLHYCASGATINCCKIFFISQFQNNWLAYYRFCCIAFHIQMPLCFDCIVVVSCILFKWEIIFKLNLLNYVSMVSILRNRIKSNNNNNTNRMYARTIWTNGNFCGFEFCGWWMKSDNLDALGRIRFRAFQLEKLI